MKKLIIPSVALAALAILFTTLSAAPTSPGGGVRIVTGPPSNAVSVSPIQVGGPVLDRGRSTVTQNFQVGDLTTGCPASGYSTVDYDKFDTNLGTLRGIKIKLGEYTYFRHWGEVLDTNTGTLTIAGSWGSPGWPSGGDLGTDGDTYWDAIAKISDGTQWIQMHQKTNYADVAYCYNDDTPAVYPYGPQDGVIDGRGSAGGDCEDTDTVSETYGSLFTDATLLSWHTVCNSLQLHIYHDAVGSLSSSYNGSWTVNWEGHAYVIGQVIYYYD